jgi:hypothetical protein
VLADCFVARQFFTNMRFSFAPLSACKDKAKSEKYLSTAGIINMFIIFKKARYIAYKLNLLYFLKSTGFSPVFKLTLLFSSRYVLKAQSFCEDYFKMTDRPKGFVLTPSRLGKPPNTEEASAAKPVFTGDVN